jgi:hypothetical protein
MATAERTTWRTRLGAALAGAGIVWALTVVVWLFAPGSAEPSKPQGVEALASIDGTLVVVEEERLVLRTFEALDGRREVEFVVRSADRRNFDLAHLRSHSSIALPARIYYEREAGRYFAVYKEDAPANSRRDAQDE